MQIVAMFIHVILIYWWLGILPQNSKHCNHLLCVPEYFSINCNLRICVINLKSANLK